MPEETSEQDQIRNEAIRDMVGAILIIQHIELQRIKWFDTSLVYLSTNQLYEHTPSSTLAGEREAGQKDAELLSEPTRYLSSRAFALPLTVDCVSPQPLTAQQEGKTKLKLNY